MVDDKPLIRSGQLMADDQGTNGIVTGPASCISCDMRIILGVSGKPERIEPCVHAYEYGYLPGGGGRQKKSTNGMPANQHSHLRYRRPKECAAPLRFTMSDRPPSGEGQVSGQERIRQDMYVILVAGLIGAKIIFIWFK